MGNSKCFGIYILGIAAIVWGLASLWAEMDYNSVHHIRNFYSQYEFYCLVILPIFSGIGVLLKKSWGRIGYILSGGFGLGSVLVDTIKDISKGLMVNNLSSSLGMLLIYAILYSIPIWYFTRPKIKEQFK